MEFALIMAVGTVVAVLAVIGSRPKRPQNINLSPAMDEFSISKKPTPTWKKDISLSHPIGELQYLEQVERYNRDPKHEPFPLEPPRHS